MADNYTFKDAGGNTVTHGSEEISAGVHVSKHVPVDDAGAIIAKAEDAAHSSGDKGYMLLAVRKDTATALAGADGDYIPLIVDANGRLHVVSAAEAAAGDVAHDAVDSGNPIKVGGKAASAAPTAVAAGDRVNAYFDTAGRLFVRMDESILERATYAPTGVGFGMYGEVENRANGNGPNTTNLAMDRLRLGSEQELLVMPPVRWAYASYGSVAQAADLAFATASIVTTPAALTTASLDGSDAGFNAATRWYFIPMLSFTRGCVIALQQTLGVTLNVKLKAAFSAASTSNLATHVTLDEVDIASAGAAIFTPYPLAAGAAATLRYVPMLNMPMYYAILEVTPASDPSSGGLLLGVSR
jgi:hypothetical protein